MAQPPGFMIYVDDWTEAAEDFTVTEIGEVLLGLLRYFQTGEVTEFSDRATKQFYKSAVKGIARDSEKYQTKCLKNTYSRYKGLCKEKGIDPLEFDDWMIENDRQRSSTDVTNTNTNSSNNPNANNKTSNQSQTQTANGEWESPERENELPHGYAPPSEANFENMRQQALAKLGL